ncbi:MAG: 30S ribosome-binding factor RbfA [Rhodobacteraceae bacterium]|nr:30S ribosome-binding factor RbfA [Paracoccaceae bacterium]|tara:strand:- start:36 stop:434 length:399 start_codon:yes stop_codon:yes gene_type:complete
MVKNNFHDNLGPSQRQLRVGELIRRILSDVLVRGEIHDPDLNQISVTVGEVVTSPDLKIATAYVSALGGNKNNTLISLLSKNKSEIRRAISKKVTLKFSPDLRFRLDETFDRIDDTRRLLADEKVRRDLDLE